jgi:hypothetical protein
MNDATAENDKFFEQLAEATQLEVCASTRIKSRLYSALMKKAQEEAPLCSLTETERAGHELCVFEKLVQILPVGKTLDSANYCRICHARVLAEQFENAPIYWKGCPYVKFQG